MASLRRSDILSLIHLRSDGRRPHEIRHMSCHLGALPSTTDCGSALPTSACSGSAMVSMGLTQVLAVVRGPADVTRRSEESPDRYVIMRLVRVFVLICIWIQVFCVICILFTSIHQRCL